MKLRFFIVLAVSVVFLTGFNGCQKKEISLLKDLQEKLKETHGDLEKGKIVLKNFLLEKDEAIKKAVQDFQESKGEDRDYRYLDFNRHYYDKDGLRELVDFSYKYTMDNEFYKLFEEFKRKWGIFFQEEPQRKKF